MIEYRIEQPPVEAPETNKRLGIWLEKDATGPVYLRVRDTRGTTWSVLVLEPDGTCRTIRNVPHDVGLNTNSKGQLVVGNEV